MQPARYQIAGDQGDWGETVESGAAQVFRRGLDYATHVPCEKAYLPMHVGPRPLPALWATEHKVSPLLHFPCHRNHPPVCQKRV